MKQKIHFIKTFAQDSNNEYQSLLQELDTNGNIIHVQEFDKDNNVIYENNQKYDDKNRLVSSEINSDKDDYSEKRTFTYGDTGKLIKEKIEYSGGWFSVKNYEYNEDTRASKITCIDEDSEVEEYSIIEFNEKGLAVCNKEYDENDKLKSMDKTTYNDDNTIATKEEYDNKGKLEKLSEYYYNENGKITLIKSSNRKGKILDWVKVSYGENQKPIEQISMSGTKIIMEYNPESNSSTELHISPNGEVITKTTTIINENGLVIEEQSNGKILKYTYEFYD